MKKEDLDADPQSMDNRRLSAIARNPNHPQATHAKAELARRKVKKAEMGEGGMKRIATTQSNKADRMASGGKKGLETFKKMKEKTLTPAEVRKRDKIAKAIKKDDPDMPIDKKMAIATATAKRVAEGLNEDKRSEIYHSHMSFHHAMKQAEYKNKNPGLAKKHDQAGSLHAKVADMHADNHPDASKHGTKADKTSKALEESLRVAEGKVDEVSSKTLSSYMRKSTASAGKPRQDVRTMDKRIGGQKMADDKLRKMQGKGSAAKVAATEADDATVRMYKDNPDMMKSKGPGGLKSLSKKAQKDVKKSMNQAAVNEVLDTPKAMQSYKDKAKYSKDKATNSAVANILRKGDHTDDLKTRAKRVKGLGMADRNATNKTAKALRKEESVNELSKDTMQSYWDKTKADDAFSGTRKANNRLKGAINVTTKLDRIKKMIKKK